MKKPPKKTDETRKQSRKTKTVKAVKTGAAAAKAEAEKSEAAAVKGKGAVEGPQAAKTEPVAGSKGLKKQYLKNDPLCKVTFRLPREAAPEAEAVAVVGEFNNWNQSKTMMEKMKNGDFTATVELERDHEYKFRYLIDSKHWENDWNADKYVRNDYGSDDSVVIV